MDEQYDYSCGIVPMRFHSGTIYFLLVRQVKGRGQWGFPKGHPEEGDGSAIDTALRELREETGLVSERIVSEEPIGQNYTFSDPKTRKRLPKYVDYFPAFVSGELVRLQLDELGEFRWVTLKELLGMGLPPGIESVARQAHKLAVAH